jgi:isopropylmalate/homocitrate/citramalate synthase
MITVAQDEGITLITYREDKRPLKLAVYVIDSVERTVQLARVNGFVEKQANAPEHLARMEPANFWAMIERLSTLCCRVYSPTTNWGVTKPEIRAAVYFFISAAISAGSWPKEYAINEKTFVQYGGERYEH